MDKILKVLEREDITGSQKLMLITLVILPEASEGISFNDIAFYTSLTRKTVIENLKTLEKVGLIEVCRNSTKTNGYKIIL